MTRVAIAGAIAASAAIIMVATYAGEGLDAVTAPRLPPPECREGVSYGGPTIPPGIARASNAMALDMYRHLSTDPAGAERNHVFSPLAAYMAASLLYEGARGETAEQLQGALALDPDEGERHEAVAQTISALRGHDPCTVFALSNALWIDADGAPPDAAFVTIARDVYGADVRAVDFGDPADGADRIDRWAWLATYGSVEDVDGGLPGSSVVLSSVARLEGTWLYQFNPFTGILRVSTPSSSTAQSSPQFNLFTGQFLKANGTAVDTNFAVVSSFFKYYNYDQDATSQRVIIPYGSGRLSMLAVIPHEVDGLPDLAGSITPELLDEWMDHPYEPHMLQIAIPTFEIGADYRLNDMLAGMGAADAFVPGEANLSGIGPVAVARGPHLTLVTHDAFLDVGGEGAIADPPTWRFDSEPHIRIVLDRPFMFFIYEEESNAILLMGSLSDPAALG